MKNNFQVGLVSVVIPAYNAELHLLNSLRSLVNQSYRLFEVIVVDDGSTDRTREICESIGDDRVQYYKNDENLGIVESLNRGISMCKGEFIARLDADDLAHPLRLERQVAYLNHNPLVAMVCSNAQVVDEMGNFLSIPAFYPVGVEYLEYRLFKYCSVFHPSVMMRRSLFQGGMLYSAKYRHCEDYSMWLEIMKSHRIACLDDTLIKYRIHSKSITALAGNQQYMNSRKALNSFYGDVFGAAPFTETELEMFMEPGKWLGSFDELEQVLCRQRELYVAFRKLDKSPKVLMYEDLMFSLKVAKTYIRQGQLLKGLQFAFRVIFEFIKRPHLFKFLMRDIRWLFSPYFRSF